MIICPKVRGLLYELEQAQLYPPPYPDSPPPGDPPPKDKHHTYNQTLKALIQTLHHNCTSAKQQAEPPQHPLPKDYPLDADGFAKAFDPLEDEAAFVAAFKTYGFVVGKQVVSPALCARAVQRLKGLMHGLSQGACTFDNPQSWQYMPADGAGVPLLSRGFFEVYHDAIWAEIRQSLRLYLHHVVLWQRADLWSSFDRFGIKLPQHPDGKALDLHVDQNPTVHPGFKTLQGILALADNPAEQGTFRCVPASCAEFSRYAAFVKPGYKGEYVPLEPSALADELSPRQQAIPLRAGDIVTWDSRLTHANTSNLSDSPRFVAMVAAGPAPKNFEDQSKTRKEAYKTGLGSNVRDALMHASMKPRFTDPQRLNHHRNPEHLNQLGEYLYGLTKYEL